MLITVAVIVFISSVLWSAVVIAACMGASREDDARSDALRIASR